LLRVVVDMTQAVQFLEYVPCQNLEIADDWKTLFSLDAIASRKPSQEALRRLCVDIRKLHKQPVPGIGVRAASHHMLAGVFVVPDSSSVTRVHALIVGPTDTPYEQGLFYFQIEIPDNCPHSPPEVRLITTDGGCVKFNPNLHKDGRVCLSLLGPQWSSVLSLSNILLSIQSLLNEQPYTNEPGYEGRARTRYVATPPIQQTRREATDYNECVAHETLRVAVLEMCDPETTLHASLPEELREMAKTIFLSSVALYTAKCDERLHMDGAVMFDPFGEDRGKFQYKLIRERLTKLEAKLSL